MWSRDVADPMGADPSATRFSGPRRDRSAGYAAPVEPARIESLDRGLWAIARPFRALDRLEVGARTTVLGLEDGGLLVHSPIRLDDSDREAIRALGPVRAIVAPNLWHHLFFGPAAEAFPSA